MEVDKTFTKDELIRQYEKLNEELAKEVQFSLALKTQLEESSKKIKELNEKSWNLERDRDKLKKKINEIVFNQIAKLEAIKMLFSIASSGHTHRSKAMFSEHAKHVIDEEIKATQHSAGVFDLHDNMPF